MKWQVREWTKNDLSAIREIALKTWLDTYLNIFTKDEIIGTHKQYYSSDRLEKLLRHRFGLIGIVNGKPVAYLIAKKRDEKQRFYINSFYVLPEFQDAGIGTRILERAIKIAKTMEYDEIWLDMMEGNKKAIGWYKHRGFAIVGKDTYKMGETETDTLVGRKKI